MRLVFLDSGPLGLLSNARGKPRADDCRLWARGLFSAGVRVFVPEIADYEVRRKLLHLGATAGVRRFDLVKATFDYAPITTDVMLRAAGFWGDASCGASDGRGRGAGRGLHPGGVGVTGGRPR